MQQVTQLTLCELKELLFQQLNENQYSDYYKYFFKIRFSALEKFMSKNGISYYSKKVGESFLEDYHQTRNVSSSTMSALNTFINRVDDISEGRGYVPRHFMGNPISLSADFKKATDNYIASCLERGNIQTTLRWKRDKCTRFCFLIQQLGCDSPNRLTASQATKVCLQIENKDAWRCVREFLQFLYKKGYTDMDFSYVVPKASKKAVLPSVYSPEEIRKIESSVDISSVAGKRNLCILLLASRLAMRSGDIVKLSFNEVDFCNNRINYIQEKTGKPQSLPLLPEVENALKDYIYNGRPASDEDSIFLRLDAPYRPLTTAAVRTVVKVCMRKGGVVPNGRRHGSHIFRSSTATSMVNDGVSYEVVRRILGHKDPNVVQHYAALDVNNLRLCALQTPEPTGYFKDLLEGRADL